MSGGIDVLPAVPHQQLGTGLEGQQLLEHGFQVLQKIKIEQVSSLLNIPKTCPTYCQK